jgi:Papain family cysteine protease
MPVRLSSQEIIDCDKSNYQCDGGYVTRVYNWGKRKGFIPESCYPFKGTAGECEDDHLESNECRINNQLYRVVDFCLA